MNRILSSTELIGTSIYHPELGARAYLRGYRVNLDESLMKAAENELIENMGSSATYNQLEIASATNAPTCQSAGVSTVSPGLLDRPREQFPATMALADHLREALLDESNTDLTFIRRALPRIEDPSIFVGNLHNDDELVVYNETNASHTGKLAVRAHQDVWRQVINLGNSERYLQIIDGELEDIEDYRTIRPASGSIEMTDMSETNAILERHPGIYTDAIRHMSRYAVIPPYDGSTLWVAELWSSAILHAGIDTPEGHFMATAGALRTMR
jgi:hypothetical protein